MAMKVCACNLFWSINTLLFIIYYLLFCFSTVQDAADFANSSFIIINNRRELNQGLSVLDFRQLFSFRLSEENFRGVYLTSYYNPNRRNDFILPNSSIGGTYTCMSGNQSQAVSVSLRSMYRSNDVLIMILIL